MTKASNILKKLLGESAYSAVPPPLGTQGPGYTNSIPNPNDAKLYSSQNRSMDIQDNGQIANKIGAIIDSLDEDDITDELADIVENYLEQVDQSGDMTVEDAAMMLPLDECQALYKELTTYLNQNGIQYSETGTSSDGLPTEVPADTYPSSAGMIMGPGSLAPSTMNIGN